MNIESKLIQRTAVTKVYCLANAHRTHDNRAITSIRSIFTPATLGGTEIVCDRVKKCTKTYSARR